MTTKPRSNTTKALYWATILSACTMGETAGDFLSFGLNFGYGWAACLLLALLVIALIAESRAKAPSERRYWVTIVIMSTTGTAMADFITRTMKLGYGGGSLLLTGLFLLIYIAERLSKTGVAIDEHSGSLPKTDFFYWAAILVASTFGTTMGDFVSDVLNFGFAGGTIFLLSLLAFVLFFEFRAAKASKPRYWAALVITSTIGATTGDYLTKPDALNLGYGLGSAILIGVFILIFTAGHFIKHES